MSIVPMQAQVSDEVIASRSYNQVASVMALSAALRESGFATRFEERLDPHDFAPVALHFEVCAAIRRVLASGGRVGMDTVALDLQGRNWPAGTSYSYVVDLGEKFLPLADPERVFAVIRQCSVHRDAMARLAKFQSQTELEGFRPEAARTALEDLGRIEALGASDPFESVPDVCDVASAETQWIVPGEIAVGAVTLLCSVGGHGKSSYALFRAIETAIQDNRHVLFLDSENPASIVRERIDRFNLSRTPERLTIYGGWLGEVPDPSDPRVLAWARQKPGALIVVDPLVAFLARAGLDENSAVDVRSWFTRGPRALANLGAGVLVLGHPGKGGGYRGSTDIRNSTDVLFELENATPGENLDRLTLRALKRRVPADSYIALEWRSDECAFRRRELTPAETCSEIMARVMTQHPGAGKKELLALATATGITYRRALQFIEDGISSGSVRIEKRGNAQSHFWEGESVDA